MISLEGLREHNPGGQITHAAATPNNCSAISRICSTPRASWSSIYDPLTTMLGPGWPEPTCARPSRATSFPPTASTRSRPRWRLSIPQPNLPGDGPGHQNNYAEDPARDQRLRFVAGQDGLHVQPEEPRLVPLRADALAELRAAGVGQQCRRAEQAVSFDARRAQLGRGLGVHADAGPGLQPARRPGPLRGLRRQQFRQRITIRASWAFRRRWSRSSRTLEFPRFNIGTYSELGIARRLQLRNAGQSGACSRTSTGCAAGTSSRFGAEFRRYNDNQLQPGVASGTYTFNAWTQANPQRADSGSGNEFASFLLGYPPAVRGPQHRSGLPQQLHRAVRAGRFQAPFEPDAEPGSALGLRIAAHRALQPHGRGFAFGQASPLASRVTGLDLKGGLLFAGDSGDSRLAFTPYRNQWQPRAGIAWQFRTGWVLRGGYGLSYLGQDANGPATGFSQPTSLIASTDGSITPAVDFKRSVSNQPLSERPAGPDR